MKPLTTGESELSEFKETYVGLKQVKQSSSSNNAAVYERPAAKMTRAQEGQDSKGDESRLTGASENQNAGNPINYNLSDDDDNQTLERNGFIPLKGSSDGQAVRWSKERVAYIKPSSDAKSLVVEPLFMRPSLAGKNISTLVGS